MSEPKVLKSEKPWMVWRFNRECTAESGCSCCGYFWGSGNEKRKEGQRVMWPNKVVSCV